MAVPTLPDAFGNYAIKGIEEVLPPDPVSWLPVTTGWKTLALLLLGWALWLLFKAHRRWLRNRYRRDALRELQRIRNAAPTARLESIAVLLKATALAAYPRREVAPLHGNEWTRWLEAEGAVLSEDSRRLLADDQYRPGTAADAAAVDRLSAEAAQWIGKHRGAAP